MTLHYRVEGEGEHPLVLLGSIGSTVDLWEPQLVALTPHFRVVRIDHPGHGASPLLDVRTIAGLAHALLATLDELAVRRFSFCGLSLGGAVGMKLALDVPERLDRLVLIATAARIARPEFWQERAETVRTRGLEAIGDTVLERWFTPSFRDVRQYREMLLSIPREGYARCCEALRDWDARGTLGAVTAPTLAIAGSDDPSTPPSDLEAIVHEIGDAQLEVIDAARHLVNVERAAEVNEALLNHLTE